MSGFIDRSGKRYGKLLVIKYVGKSSNGNYIWECLCECGSITYVEGRNLTSGTKSCGCLQREKATKHSEAKKGGRSSTYRSWESMKRRCDKPKMIGYKYWGGRGITYCFEWNNYENFLRDMGDRPENRTLDRIDNNGNYCKDNCRWATHSEQVINRRKYKKGGKLCGK